MMEDSQMNQRMNEQAMKAQEWPRTGRKIKVELYNDSHVVPLICERALASVIAQSGTRVRAEPVSPPKESETAAQH